MPCRHTRASAQITASGEVQDCALGNALCVLRNWRGVPKPGSSHTMDWAQSAPANGNKKYRFLSHRQVSTRAEMWTSHVQTELMHWSYRNDTTHDCCDSLTIARETYSCTHARSLLHIHTHTISLICAHKPKTPFHTIPTGAQTRMNSHSVTHNTETHTVLS